MGRLKAGEGVPVAASGDPSSGTMAAAFQGARKEKSKTAPSESGAPDTGARKKDRRPKKPDSSTTATLPDPALPIPDPTTAAGAPDPAAASSGGAPTSSGGGPRPDAQSRRDDRRDGRRAGGSSADNRDNRPRRRDPLPQEELQRRAEEIAYERALFVGDRIVGVVEANRKMDTDNPFVIRQGRRMLYLEGATNLADSVELVGRHAQVEIIQVLGTRDQYKAVITGYDQKESDGTLTKVPIPAAEIRGIKNQELTKKERLLGQELDELPTLLHRVSPRERIEKLQLRVTDADGRIAEYAGRISTADRRRVHVPTIRKIDVTTHPEVEKPVYILGQLEGKAQVEGLFEHDIEVIAAVDLYHDILRRHEMVLRNLDTPASTVGRGKKSRKELQVPDAQRAKIQQQRRATLDALSAIGAITTDDQFHVDVKALYDSVRQLDAELAAVEAVNQSVVAELQAGGSTGPKQDVLLFELHRYRQELQADYADAKQRRMNLLIERERFMDQEEANDENRIALQSIENNISRIEDLLEQKDPTGMYMRAMNLSRLVEAYLGRYPELDQLGRAGGLEFMKFQEELLRNVEGQTVSGEQVELWPTSTIRHRDHQKTALNADYFDSREHAAQQFAPIPDPSIIYFAYSKDAKGRLTRQQYTMRPTEALQNFRVDGENVYFTQSFINDETASGLELQMSTERQMPRRDFVALFGEKDLVIDSMQSTMTLFEQALRGASTVDLVNYVRGFGSLGPEGGISYESFIVNDNEISRKILEIVRSRLAEYLGVPIDWVTISKFQSKDAGDPLRIQIQSGKHTEDFLITGNTEVDADELDKLFVFKQLIDAERELAENPPAKKETQTNLNDVDADTSEQNMRYGASGDPGDQSDVGLPKTERAPAEPQASPLQRVLRELGLGADYPVDQELRKGTLRVRVTGLVSYRPTPDGPRIYPVAYDIHGLSWDDEKPDDEAKLRMTERYAAVGGLAEKGKSMVARLGDFKKVGPFRAENAAPTIPEQTASNRPEPTAAPNTSPIPEELRVDQGSGDLRRWTTDMNSSVPQFVVADGVPASLFVKQEKRPPRTAAPTTPASPEKPSTAKEESRTPAPVSAGVRNPNARRPFGVRPPASPAPFAVPLSSVGEQQYQDLLTTDPATLTAGLRIPTPPSPIAPSVPFVPATPPATLRREVAPNRALPPLPPLPQPRTADQPPLPPVQGGVDFAAEPRRRTGVVLPATTGSMPRAALSAPVPESTASVTPPAPVADRRVPTLKPEDMATSFEGAIQNIIAQMPADKRIDLGTAIRRIEKNEASRESYYSSIIRMLGLTPDESFVRYRMNNQSPWQQAVLQKKGPGDYRLYNPIDRTDIEIGAVLQEMPVGASIQKIG